MEWVMYDEERTCKLMISFDLHFKVKVINESQILINGYQYHEIIAGLNEGPDMKCYIPQRMIPSIKVDGHYYTNKAFLTSVDFEKEHSHEVVIRIGMIQPCSEEEFLNSGEAKVKVNGLIQKGKNTVIKQKGVMMTNTISSTVNVKNEFDVRIPILIVGFNGNAATIDNLSRVCYADVYGTLSRRNPKRPVAIVISDIIVRKEVM